MLTCNDYDIFTIIHVFSCHGLKLCSHISNPFIYHACSARKVDKEELDKEISQPQAGEAAGTQALCKTLQCKASQGGSAQPQQQFPSKLPSPRPSGLTRDWVFLLKFFFTSLDERTLPLYKRGSLSDSQQDRSHPFQHFPRITIQQHLHVPADSSQESIICTPCACLQGLCGFEVPLRLFISMTNDHCESLWSRIRTLLHLTIYKTG